MLFRA